MSIFIYCVCCGKNLKKIINRRYCSEYCNNLKSLNIKQNIETEKKIKKVFVKKRSKIEDVIEYYKNQYSPSWDLNHVDK